MEYLSQYKISSDAVYSHRLKLRHITDFHRLSLWVKNLAYSRISNPEKLHLVVEENCGTCSSKHAFYCSVALENAYTEFDLVVGIYKMNNSNTPGIGDAISKNKLEYIPEAHCYIRFGSEVIDLTKPYSIYHAISDDILYQLCF